MTLSERAEEAINIVIQQGNELADIGNSATSSGGARLGFERLNRWKDRTVRLLSEKIHPNEGQKLKDKPTYSFRTHGIDSENFFEAVSIYAGFLTSLLEALKGHPEDVLDLPTISDKETNVAKDRQPISKRKPKDADELIYLYDTIKLHSRIIGVSRELFKNKHYAQAIFEAYKAVENFVQDKSGETLYGTNLMEKVFNEENPIIKVPEAGHYYKDVQRGFKHLFIGAAQGIRNPKAHKEVIQKDPYITLQYLGFFSFLLKRIDYWDKVVS